MTALGCVVTDVRITLRTMGFFVPVKGSRETRPGSYAYESYLQVSFPYLGVDMWYSVRRRGSDKRSLYSVRFLENEVSERLVYLLFTLRVVLVLHDRGGLDSEIQTIIPYPLVRSPYVLGSQSLPCLDLL